MKLDLDRLRPGYNATAAAASLLAAPWWGGVLTDSASTYQGTPLGLTAAALLATGTINLALPIWPTRALLCAPITALVVSPAAAHAVLAFATGASQ